MKKLFPSIVLFVLFIIFTVLVKTVDLLPIGPEGSVVGFASVNGAVHEFFGMHLFWYGLTEFFGVLALCVCCCFGLAGCIQLIKRRSLFKIDKEIIALGFFYVVVIAFYVFFEKVIINYRPVILDEGLEASYPSSHTILILCVFGTAFGLLKKYIKNTGICFCLRVNCLIIMFLTVLGRLICGVHWFTDIAGGILLSCSLLSGFGTSLKLIAKKELINSSK